MNLILAQGAEHTKPENMAKILKVIEQERNGIADKMYKSASDCEHKIEDIYGCDIHNLDNYICVSPYSYAVEEKYDGYSYINSEGKLFRKRLSQAKG